MLEGLILFSKDACMAIIFASGFGGVLWCVGDFPPLFRNWLFLITLTESKQLSCNSNCIDLMVKIDHYMSDFL